MLSTLVLRCVHAPFVRFVASESAGVLGRSSVCDFVLNERSVSRRHAKIRIQESGLHISDLGSRNGTFVNERRVVSDHVASGQLVRFGKVEFMLMAEDLAFLQSSSEEETDKPPHWIHENGKRAQPSDGTLSDAQRRVFDLIVARLPEKAISRRLNLSKHTVHTHTQNIFKAFGVHSRTQLLASLIRPSKLQSSP